MKHQKIVVTLNVPDQVVEEFQAIGWRLNTNKDSPVVSGVVVPEELIWDKECDPLIPVGYSISCPDSEGYCTIDGIKS